MRIANNGTVSISSTTAGSSGAGALVVAGGLATGAASYIGGTLTVSAGRINGTANGVGIMGAATSDSALTAYGTTNDSTKLALVAKDSGGNNLFLVRNDGAATFAGAVTVSGGTTHTTGTSGVFKATGTSSTGAAESQYFNDATNGVFGVGGSAAATTAVRNKFFWYGLGGTVLNTLDGSGNQILTNNLTVGGALKLGNPYVGTVIVPTGYVTIQDSNGNTYKIAVSA